MSEDVYVKHYSVLVGKRVVGIVMSLWKTGKMFSVDYVLTMGQSHGCSATKRVMARGSLRSRRGDGDMKKLVVSPMKYESKPYDYSLTAEQVGDEGIYDEMAVAIRRISDGFCIGDAYFLIDRESGEPCILVTADGRGDGDHAIRIFPMRPREQMIEEEEK